MQIEYALNAVSGGATSLGISGVDGVVIATEKKLPSALVDETTVQKISILSPNIGVVYSGMGPDYRVLVRKARKTAQAYYQLYKEHIPVAQLVREVAAVMQEFTRKWGGGFSVIFHPARASTQRLSLCAAESGGVRPFGVSLLLAGFDDNGPQLYQIDPSGSYFAWKASAIGKNMTNAKTFLEKRYSEEVGIEDAVHTALLTLKEGFEGQVSGSNIEVGIIGLDRKFKILSETEVSDYLQEVE